MGIGHSTPKLSMVTASISERFDNKVIGFLAKSLASQCS